MEATNVTWQFKSPNHDFGSRPKAHGAGAQFEAYGLAEMRSSKAHAMCLQRFRQQSQISEMLFLISSIHTSSYPLFFDIL